MSTRAISFPEGTQSASERDPTISRFDATRYNRSLPCDGQGWILSGYPNGLFYPDIEGQVLPLLSNDMSLLLFIQVLAQRKIEEGTSIHRKYYKSSTKFNCIALLLSPY